MSATPTLQQIYDAAEACHAALKATDPSLPVWADLGATSPAWLNDLLHVAQEIAEGRVTRPEHVQDARVAKQRAAGWPYGLSEEEATALHPHMARQVPASARARDGVLFAAARASLARAAAQGAAR